MEIDIAQPALSAEAIEKRKAEISAELAEIYLKRKRIIKYALFIPISILLMATATNFVFALFPWVVIPAIFIAIAIAMVSFVVSLYVCDVVGVGAGISNVIRVTILVKNYFYYSLFSRIGNISGSEAALIKHFSNFDHAGKEASLEIKEWLSDKVIAGFHESVLTESRLPTIGEVDAMRNHWESRDQRAEDTERKKEINAAFNELYGKSLVNE